MHAHTIALMQWTNTASSHHSSFHSPVHERARCIAPIHGNWRVASLSQELLELLAISSQADDIFLRAYGAHIQKKRAKHSERIIPLIPVTFEHISHVGSRIGTPQSRHIVGKCGVGKSLLVGLKFVPALLAPSRHDEAWVTTAYFVDAKEITRLLKKGQLRPVLRHHAA